LIRELEAATRPKLAEDGRTILGWPPVDHPGIIRRWLGPDAVVRQLSSEWPSRDWGTLADPEAAGWALAAARMLAAGEDVEHHWLTSAPDHLCYEAAYQLVHDHAGEAAAGSGWEYVAAHRDEYAAFGRWPELQRGVVSENECGAAPSVLESIDAAALRERLERVGAVAEWLGCPRASDRRGEAHACLGCPEQAGARCGLDERENDE